MRAMWKGAIAFGLVSVPVRMYTATENHDVKFHQVRASDGSRIRYKRVAEADGEEVPYQEIAKGYEAADGRIVILTDEDLAELPNQSGKEIAVEKFVPAEQIDPILFEKSYYLEPEKNGLKPYALLREALREADRMAVVRITVRARETMALLRVRDGVIVLQTMLWPDEVRSAAFDILDDVPEPKDAEVAMANMLIESMADDFDPDEYEDDYQEAVEALVRAKLEGGDVTTAPTGADEEPGQVVDLLAALQRSVDRAKAARGEVPEKTTAPPAADAEDGGTTDATTAKDATATAGDAPATDTPAASDDAEAGSDEPGGEEPEQKPPVKRASAKQAATKTTKKTPRKAG